MPKPSVLFLNGPADMAKEELISHLRKKFETSCIAINRVDLLGMLNAYDEEKEESHEWLVPKIIKGILNNGVYVLFDAFLPTRRMEQYVAQMRGLPCYWIGIFLNDHGSELYDFSVNLRAASKTRSVIEQSDDVDESTNKCEELTQDCEKTAHDDEELTNDCEKTTDDSKELTDDTEKVADSEEEFTENENYLYDEYEDETFRQMSPRRCANVIFDFIMNNQPKYFQSVRDVDVVSRRRTIEERETYDNTRVYIKAKPVFSSFEEMQEYKENKFRSLKNKYTKYDEEKE